ncbi:hypothetical protein TanjilG_06926 [Lupinus angustifolius]|uniref:C2H2-type domain-containing protein n=1 Tax=Lupinus angustifolius TaxID=3871 RepID=A0A4P1QV70_LUPAN|nr:hypothetical protein TanjilG_06926 [Lupinus angustifolius]
MASKNLQIADPAESSGDSGSAGSSKTNTKTYKCIECFKPFPTRVMLIQHQREDEACRSSQMIKAISKNTLNSLSFSQPTLQSLPSPSSPPSIPKRNISTLELLSSMLPSSSLPPPSPVEPNATNLALYPTFPPLSPSIVELNTSILAPSPTLPQPSLPNVKSYISSFAPALAPALAPLPSPPCDAANPTNYHHAYLMQEIMSIDAAAAAAYGEDDNCFSPDNRTLDLISQLDPTRNFLCLIDQQSEQQSGNNVNGGDAAPGPSVEMEPLDMDLDFKI